MPRLSPPLEDASSASRRWLWVVALVCYGLGDAATTAVGLQYGSVAEVGPLAAALIGRHSLGGLVALKLVTFGVAYAVWHVLRTPSRDAIPLALAVVGVAVTLWNLAVIGSV